MLFNSYEFIFLFLPITVIVFFQIAKYNHHVAAAWLGAASLFFYGWWNPIYVLLLLASIVFNYTIGISLYNIHELKKERKKSIVLAFGIAINLFLLGYFKYFNFFIGTLNASFGMSFEISTIVLPLGISFFTFTQIAFLVDASRGLAHEFNFVHYILFVTYFPHLIAGPVLHHKEMMPQFDKSEIYRFNYQCIAIGLTIFIIGLFKKVMLADEMIKYVKPVFESVANGNKASFKESWGAALSYTLQLYFDFSGYSDMAIGMSRMFGIKLPLNFNSPYRSVNIIEFWRRWHMTLSRFLRDYLYISLGGNRKGVLRRYINLMLTMVLGGLWHGAGWTFVVWGGLHGTYLIINHAWQAIRKKMGHDLTKSTLLGNLTGGLITFIAVVIAWVFFRADSLQSGISITQSMLGMNGFVFTGRFQLSMIAKLLIIVWVLPNTQQVMAKYEPALAMPETNRSASLNWFKWQPNWIWLIIIFLLASQSLLQGDEASEFLYFQF
jgi:alginate O-acetyltransferase complex protein AlgI